MRKNLGGANLREGAYQNLDSRGEALIRGRALNRINTVCSNVLDLFKIK